MKCVMVLVPVALGSASPYSLAEEQFPISPIHELSRQVKYQVSPVSLHRIIKFSESRFSQAPAGGSTSAQPNAGRKRAGYLKIKFGCG